jgi:hypothetical protein
MGEERRVSLFVGDEDKRQAPHVGAAAGSAEE